MKRLRKQHVLEQSIYGAIWIVIFLLPLIGGYFAMSGGLEREETRMGTRLFDSQFFSNLFRQCVFVYKNIHSLVSNECFGSIPDTIVFA